MAIYINQDPRVTSISTGASAATIGRHLRKGAIRSPLKVSTFWAYLEWSEVELRNKQGARARTNPDIKAGNEAKQRRRLARPPAEYVWPSNLLRQLRI